MSTQSRSSEVPDPPLTHDVVKSGVPCPEIEAVYGESRRQYFTAWMYEEDKDRFLLLLLLPSQSGTGRLQEATRGLLSPRLFRGVREFMYFYNFESEKYWGTGPPRHRIILNTTHELRSGSSTTVAGHAAKCRPGDSPAARMEKCSPARPIRRCKIGSRLTLQCMQSFRRQIDLSTASRRVPPNCASVTSIEVAAGTAPRPQNPCYWFPSRGRDSFAL